MRLMACALAMVGLVGVLEASQQPTPKATSRPDFIGNWTNAAGEDATGRAVNVVLQEKRGNGPDGALLVGPTPTALIISQEGTMLIVEEHRQFIVTRNRVEHGLNGEPVKTAFVIEPPRPAAPAEVTSKWEQNALVSTIDVEVPGEPDPRHYVETMSMSPEGILAVKIQRAGTPDSRTLFYKRTK